MERKLLGLENNPDKLRPIEVITLAFFEIPHYCLE
jgi:hypothetical protein